MKVRKVFVKRDFRRTYFNLIHSSKVEHTQFEKVSLFLGDFVKRIVNPPRNNYSICGLTIRFTSSTPPMSKTTVQIEESWKIALATEFEQPYFQKLRQFLKAEKAAGKVIFPPGPLIFNAFNSLPLTDVKVVILGQDPYIRPNQAMGLSFSVPKDIRTPPSLKNIYKELHTDIGFTIPTHGDLTAWVQQGIFLLNAALTVEEGNSGSHLKEGWGQFTDAVIRTISTEREGVVFLLWGGFAKRKRELIDESKHLVLAAAHPSPMAGGAFFGNKHFSKTNAYLTEQGKAAIDWQIV